MSNTTEIGRIAFSALGALAFTVGCIGFAVVPARAASPIVGIAAGTPATGLVGAVRY